MAKKKHLYINATINLENILVFEISNDKERIQSWLNRKRLSRILNHGSIIFS